MAVDTVLFSFLLDEARKEAGDYDAMGVGWSMTSSHWPALAEFMEGPGSDSKSEAEVAKDKEHAARETEPPTLCGNCCSNDKSKTAPGIAYTGAPASA